MSVRKKLLNATAISALAGSALLVFLAVAGPTIWGPAADTTRRPRGTDGAGRQRRTSRTTHARPVGRYRRGAVRPR